VRPFFAPPPRTFQRTFYRPGEIVQFDVWQPREGVPVGHGQTRRGWVVIACLGYSRAGSGVLVFSSQTEDLLAGIAGCLERLGGLPRTLVWDRQAGIHGDGGRPSEAFAAFCGHRRGLVTSRSGCRLGCHAGRPSRGESLTGARRDGADASGRVQAGRATISDWLVMDVIR
jgi:hypothetical protein